MADCATHHHACDCREEMVREMCRYLLAFDRSIGVGKGVSWNSLSAAAMIAQELYPEDRRQKVGK